MVILMRLVSLMKVVKEKVMLVMKSVRMELIIVSGKVVRMISGCVKEWN